MPTTKEVLTDPPLEFSLSFLFQMPYSLYVLLWYLFLQKNLTSHRGKVKSFLYDFQGPGHWYGLDVKPRPNVLKVWSPGFRGDTLWEVVRSWVPWPYQYIKPRIGSELNKDVPATLAGETGLNKTVTRVCHCHYIYLQPHSLSSPLWGEQPSSPRTPLYLS